MLHFISSCSGEDDLHSSIQMAGNAPNFTGVCSSVLPQILSRLLEAAFHGWPVSGAWRYNSILMPSLLFYKITHCAMWLTLHMLENVERSSGKEVGYLCGTTASLGLEVKKLSINRSQNDAHIIQGVLYKVTLHAVWPWLHRCLSFPWL